MGKRKSKASLSAQSDIKENDIIWVNYKKTEWPAKVSKVYPGKITYFYLPLEANKGPPFKTNPKAVRLMQADDQIPPDADAELRRAFTQAKAILQNPGEQFNFNDTGGSSTFNGSLAQDDNESQSKPTRMSAGWNKNKKKEATKELRSEHDLEDEDEEANGEQQLVNFNVGDVVTVASEIGTWPGKILEIFDDYTTCKLFPLSENNEPCRVIWDNIQPFPLDDLDMYMNEMQNNENLYAAFRDVKRYLNSRTDEPDQPLKEVKSKGKETGRKRRAASEKDSEVESEQETNTRTRSKRKQDNEKASKKAHKASASPDAVPTDPVAKQVSKQKSFLELITSYEAEQHLKSIWEETVKNDAHKSYNRPSSFNQLKFDFDYGGLLSFEDVEKLIPKIKGLTKLCPKLPAMSELVEFHYIVNVVLPQLCIFGLSKSDGGTSLDQAKGQYEQLLAENTVNTKDSLITSNGSGTISNSLLMAVNIAKNQEEQKPDV